MRLVKPRGFPWCSAIDRFLVFLFSPILTVFLLGSAFAAVGFNSTLRHLDNSWIKTAGLECFALFILVVLLGVLLRLLSTTRHIAKDANTRWSNLWHLIAASSPTTRIICRGFNGVYILVASFWQLTSIAIIVVAGAASLAFVLLHIGQYSSAEYLHHTLPAPNYSQYTALSTRHCDSRPVCKMHATDDRDRKIAAIVQVYGRDSVQAGRHYLLLSNEHLNQALDLKKSNSNIDALRQYQAAKNYAISSLAISKKNEDNSSCVESIGIIAMCNLGQGDRAGAKSALMSALQTPSLQLGSGPICTSDEDLLYVAEQTADAKLLKAIKVKISRRPLKVGSQIEHLTGSNFDTLKPKLSWVDLAFYSCMLLTSLKFVERKLLSSIFSRYWLKQLYLCKEEAERIDLLDKLTTLKIYQGDIDQADAYSKLMLRRCEELQCA